MDDVGHLIENLPERVCQSLSSYQRGMARYLLEMSRMEGLAELKVGRALPYRLLHCFQKVMSLFDESTQSFLGQLRRNGLTIRCGTGCSHCCCHMPTGLSTIELIYIYQGMNQSGVLPKFFRRCLEAEEVWVEVLHQQMIASSFQPDLGGGRSAMLQRYQHNEKPCPFLEDSRCQIYPYRPFACRTHFSISPPYWCHPSHFQNPDAVRFNLEPGECVFNALERLDNRFQLSLSDVMVCGLLELTVNVMQFDRIHWFG